MSERKEFDKWLMESQYVLASPTTQGWLWISWMARARKANSDNKRLVEALRNLEMWAPKDIDVAEDARALLAEIGEGE